MTTIEEQAVSASIHRLGTHTVGILNRIRTVGYDPITGKRGDSEEHGTGCAGRWGAHYFILTAGHVLEKAELNDLGFHFSASRRIEPRHQGQYDQQGIQEALPLKDKSAVIHRCNWEDLAVVSINPNAIPSLEFFDASNQWTDPTVGETVHCLGFPTDFGQLVGKKMVGTKEERTIALYSTVFSAAVTAQEKLNFKIAGFNPDTNYLVPYESAIPGSHPRGFSGAAVWSRSDKKQRVWTPKFKFGGVCTDEYKDGSVLRVVKASAVRRFLKEVFGSAPWGRNKPLRNRRRAHRPSSQGNSIKD